MYYFEVIDKNGNNYWISFSNREIQINEYYKHHYSISLDHLPSKYAGVIFEKLIRDNLINDIKNIRIHLNDTIISNIDFTKLKELYDNFVDNLTTDFIPKSDHKTIFDMDAWLKSLIRKTIIGEFLTNRKVKNLFYILYKGRHVDYEDIEFERISYTLYWMNNTPCTSCICYTHYDIDIIQEILSRDNIKIVDLSDFLIYNKL